MKNTLKFFLDFKCVFFSNYSLLFCLFTDPFASRGNMSFTVQLDGGFVSQWQLGPFVSPLLDFGDHNIKVIVIYDVNYALNFP